MKNSIDTIGNRSRDLPSTTRHRVPPGYKKIYADLWKKFQRDLQRKYTFYVKYIFIADRDVYEIITEGQNKLLSL
jgi:hypothetical protein